MEDQHLIAAVDLLGEFCFPCLSQSGKTPDVL